MSTLDEFRAKVNSFSNLCETVEAGQKDLLASRDQFSERLRYICPPITKLSKKNPLEKGARDVMHEIRDCIDESLAHWDRASEMRELSDELKDRIVFLIHGKVNSGKSSLCNYLATNFSIDQVKYFCVQDGQLRDLPEVQFAEGATETTAQLQGIHLAERFTILDTPGLHSTTAENAKLTGKFMDTADAVMWVTPSTAPGQVHELENLTAEIKKRIPILPVICRSDEYVEDENSAGEVERFLRNKSAARRKGQEADVYDRACCAIASSNEAHSSGSHETEANEVKSGSGSSERDLVIAPVSLSVHAYRASPGTDKDFEESGLSEFFQRASELVDEAARKKPQKKNRQVASYLDQYVLKPLRERLGPTLAKLKTDIAVQRSEFEQTSGVDSPAAARITGNLYDNIEEWAEELSKTRDRDELARRINGFIKEEIDKELRESVDRFQGSVAEAVQQVAVDDVGSFKDVTIEYDSVSGSSRATVGAAAGAAAGAGAGMALGPLGAAIGGTIGGLLGSQAGAVFIETKTLKKTVGVDSKDVIDKALLQGKAKITENLESAFEPWKKALDEMSSFVQEVENELAQFEKELEQTRATLDMPGCAR